MNAVTKVLVVLVLLLSAGFAASQIVLYGKREDFGAKYLETAQQLTDTTQKLKQAEGALHDKTVEYDQFKVARDTEVQALQNSLADEKTRVRELSADLARMTTSVQSLTTANQEQEQRLAVRDQTVEGLREIVTERDEAIKQNLDKIEELIAGGGEKDATIGELEHQLNQVKKANVELAESEKFLHDTIAGLIRRGIEVEPALAPAINGKVIQVDAVVGAAVIDKGAVAGVKPNTQFTIYNDEGYVASLVIHTVQDELAVGKVMLAAEGRQVSQGDKATTEVR